jgi:RNA polymerase sigma factor (sigma-70 family)
MTSPTRFSRRFLSIDAERVHELALKARAGDVEARNRIVEEYAPRVLELASRYRVRGQARGFGSDDLFSEGILGLIGAIPRWDTSRGVSLWLFARQRVIGAMRDALRRYGPMIRTPRGEAELDSASLPQRVAESLRGREPAPGAAAEAAELRAALDSMMECELSAEERDAVRLRYGLGGRGSTARAAAGDVLGVSRQRAWDLRMSGVRKLARRGARHRVAAFAGAS